MNHKFRGLDNWLALAIGNSRLHWAWFQQDVLVETWHTTHLANTVEPNCLPQNFLPSQLQEKQLAHLTQIPVCIASVVPEQTKLWQNYQRSNILTLEDIALGNIYPSLGIDRALAVWGAVSIYNQPCLVIDGGTALSLTGVDHQPRLIGGAILPGLRSQLTTLIQKTAALPAVALPPNLPPRWALGTEEAISSGIIYTAIAGIHSYIIDWQQQYPDSKLLFTGGDGELLAQYFSLQFPVVAQTIIIDPQLVFRGIKMVYYANLLSDFS